MERAVRTYLAYLPPQKELLPRRTEAISYERVPNIAEKLGAKLQFYANQLVPAQMTILVWREFVPPQTS
jgi:hypothetical protein